MDKQFKVGYARIDITPEKPMPLCGYGNCMTRMSNEALEPICATCICFLDEKDQPLFLYTLDLLGISKGFADTVIRVVGEAYRLTPGQVILCATHTHSAPDVLGLGCKDIEDYWDWLAEDALPKLADAAYKDAAPARMEYARTQNEGMNYIRHYLLENGTVAGDNHGDFTSAPIRCHVTETDRQIQIVKILREAGKDILMMNWQAHPNMASTRATEYGWSHRPYISADFIGPCREYLEEKTGMHFAYFQGASGNINSRSRLETEVDTRSHVEYGQQLGDYVLAAMQDMKPLAAGSVAAQSRTLSGRVDHTEDHLAEKAKEIAEEWKKTNDPYHCTRLGAPYGIYSPYHALSILVKVGMSQELPFTLSAAHAGGLGFAALPYEPFDVNGIRIKTGSPFEMTFVLGYANGYYNYIPSKQGFEYGCYESDSCKHIRGTGEEAAELALSILRELKGE